MLCSSYRAEQQDSFAGSNLTTEVAPYSFCADSTGGLYCKQNWDQDIEFSCGPGENRYGCDKS